MPLVKPGLPLKLAVMLWLPSASAEVVSVATPADTLAVPSVVALSMKVTVPPVGAPAPLVTVAVNVTGLPTSLGFCDDASVVVVVERLMVWVRVLDVDPALLLWEFEHFLEYGVVARNGRPMCADDYPIVQAEFRRIAEFMAGQPRVFTHRDYHSRNLMVDGARLGVIDFQDALMGPATYDLASLLRDAYIQLDEAVVDELVAYYLDRFEDYAMFGIDRRGFRHAFDLTSIQRNLKAAGRFVYIDRVKHNPKFLADIPRVLGYVRRNLEKYPELATLRKHLAPYVPELQ